MERRGGYTGGRFGGRGGIRGRRSPQGGRGDDFVVYCYYCKELGHRKHQCPF